MLEAIRGLDVLVVDDDPDSQAILCALLEHSGARVTCASSADEALEHMSSGYRFQVLVSDLSMPVRDGLWLMSQLKSRAAVGGHRILAIAVSGHALPEFKAAALNAGFDMFLPKPIDPDALLKAVTRYGKA